MNDNCMIPFLDQLWKFNGSTLINKANLWQTQGNWNFVNKNENISKSKIIHIRNNPRKKVLEMLSNGTLIEIEFNENKTEQSWIRGYQNNEGYFTIASHDSKLLTSASSQKSLIVQGKICSPFNDYNITKFKCYVL